MRLEISSLVPECSEIVKALYRDSLQLNGMRVSDQGTSVSFKMLDPSMPVILYFEPSLIDFTAYLGRLRIVELPYLCARNDLWGVLHDLSAKQEMDVALERTRTCTDNRRSGEIFKQHDVADDRTRYWVRAQLEDMEGEYWIAARDHDDAGILLDYVLDCDRPARTLAFMSQFGWRRG